MLLLVQVEIGEGGVQINNLTPHGQCTQCDDKCNLQEAWTVVQVALCGLSPAAAQLDYQIGACFTTRDH
jgi:hypothetical protein